MRPLLAHVYEPHRVTYPCYVQPKLNGIRALYQNGFFQSRDLQSFPVRLLDHLAKSLLSLFEPNVILDGELYVHGWPLQRIMAAVTPVRQEPTTDTIMVEYHVFDVVDFKKSFRERMRTLWLIDPIELAPKKIFAVQTFYYPFQSACDDQYVQCVFQGYEGMMYRLGDCPYTVPKQEKAYQTQGGNTGTRFLSDQDNRCWHLLKRKSWQDDEFECIDIEEGEGKYKGMTGALHCQVMPGRHVYFSVSGGLTDAQRSLYFSQPELIIGKKIKVKYLVLSSDQIPLNPTILAIL